MILQRLQIADFRCIAELDLVLTSPVSVIAGPNGAGKTSVIESAYYATRGRSFRQPRSDRLVRHGQSTFRIVATLQLGGRERRVGLEYGRGVHRIRIDGADARNLADISGKLVLQVIEPEIHQLVSEGPEGRRRFLDYGVFHVEPRYLPAWQRYRKTLKQRNAVLRAGGSASELGTWDRALVAAGELIDSYRNGYAQLLREPIAETAARLGLDNIDVAYRPGWESGQTMLDALAANLERDRQLRQTSVGPHRADLRVSWSGRLAKSVVSRGQQKLLASSLILAQARLLAGLKNDEAVMLVDDPAAELDADALARLMRELEDMPGQLVITGLDAEIPGLPEQHDVFHVEHGALQAEHR
ncbi:MAG: DNA replication/repair protein RecF [Pseudomonadota bacterium]